MVEKNVDSADGQAVCLWLMGPTSSGKTSLAVAFVDHLQQSGEKKSSTMMVMRLGIFSGLLWGLTVKTGCGSSKLSFISLIRPWILGLTLSSLP